MTAPTLTRITSPRYRCPSPSRPASLACPAPHRPGSPSSAASPLSAPLHPSPAQRWGRGPVANVSNQQNRRRDSPPRHHRASNSGSVPARRRTASPRPIRPFPLRLPRPGWPGQARPRGAAPALPHGLHFTPPTLRSTQPALRVQSSPRPNTVGSLKGPTKTECKPIMKFYPPGLAASWTRRSCAAWTYCTTITAIH